MKREFVIPGEPQGKGRPRFSVNSRRGFVQVHTPERTAVYENLVKVEYMAQCKGDPFPDKAMLRMDIKAYFAIPKSASKKAKAEMAAGARRPVKKPDADNIIKTIADALNGIAYHDDSQIVSVNLEKYFSEKPRVEAEITEATNEEKH